MKSTRSPFLIRLLNASGLSLVEVMIGGSILGGIALAGAQLFRDRFKTEAGLEHERELDKFHANLQKILYDVNHCNATFQPWYNQTSIPASIPLNDISEIYLCQSGCLESNTVNPANPTPVTRSTDPVVAEAITFPNSPFQWISPKRTWRVRDFGMLRVTRTGRADINVLYELFPNNAKPKIVMKTLAVNLRFGSSNRFVSCASEKEANVESLGQAFCETISGGGTITSWNPTTKRCVVTTNPASANCTAGGNMVKGIRSDGVVTCESITENVDTTQLIDASDANCMGGARRPMPFYDSGTKKIRVICYP